MIEALREVKGGTPAVNVCRRLGITQTTFYRWRHKFGGLATSESRQVRELRAENIALKQLVAELLLGRKGPPR